MIALSDKKNPMPFLQLGAGAISLLVLTSIHHAYGAVIFETPWRFHMLAIALPLTGAVGAVLLVAYKARKFAVERLFLWLSGAAILPFPVMVVGIYEGGYNHLVKNIVFFASGEDAALAMFPPPAFEMPVDFWFEATGVLQLPFALYTGYLMVKILARPGKDRLQ